MKHFTHEHNLWPLRWTPTGFRCSMCDCVDIPGEHSGYGCYECLYFLNKTCAELPQHLDHLLHTQHSLKLAMRSPSTRCYYCEKTFGNEYGYGCEECAFFMHMKCAVIPLPKIIAGEGGDGKVQFLCHGDPMKLVEEGDDGSKGGEAKCFACQLAAGSGPAYTCAPRKCGNFLHKACVDKLPREIQQHPFHPRHPLALQVSKPRSCLFCCKKDCRLVFGCNEKGCELFFIGVECAFLKTSVKCRSHDHLLYLVEEASCDIHCYACQTSYEKSWPDQVVPEEVKRTRSLQFRCLECNFNLHFLCGPLPSTIKHQYHVDDLTLVEHSVVEDGSDEYYCDSCEQEIGDTQFRVYHCGDCKYVAHIHCVISEIMKIIKGDTKDIKLVALGEDRWVLNIEEISDGNNSENNESTLKDIMEGLTEKEKNMLANPFAFDRKSHNAYRQNAYNHFKRVNSTRFDRRGSVFDDIGVLQRFFSLDSNRGDEFGEFLEEIWNYTPTDNLKLDDMFLRQQVVDVSGYSVPKTLAGILETLLRKHGDLGGDPSLTPGMKSVASTLLCIVVDKMCRTRVEEITKDELKHWYFYLEAIRKITRFDIVELESFHDFIVPIFLGFEATRLEKEICKVLDKRIAEQKEELKRLQESREKLKTYTSTPSDFMKDCLRKASEWKKKFLGDKWFNKQKL